MSYNFNNEKIFKNEQLHIDSWLKNDVVLKRNNTLNKFAPDAIYNDNYLDIKDSSNFDKYKDFRFDAVSYHCFDEGPLNIANNSFNVNTIRLQLLNLNPKIKLGTLFNNYIRYQSTKIEYKNNTYIVLIDLNIIRKENFNSLLFFINDKRKYNLKDNYASAFITISASEIKNKAAILKRIKIN